MAQLHLGLTEAIEGLERNNYVHNNTDVRDIWWMVDNYRAYHNHTHGHTIQDDSDILTDPLFIRMQNELRRYNSRKVTKIYY